MKKFSDKFAAPQAAGHSGSAPAPHGKGYHNSKRLVTTLTPGAFAWSSLAFRTPAPAATRWIE